MSIDFDNPRQVIFIHIPRTAGTSIELWFQCHYPTTQRSGPRRWKRDSAFTTTRHMSTVSLLRSKCITREWWDSSFKFAIVRNPWDRLVSLYEYLRGFRLRRANRRSNKVLHRFKDFASNISSGSSSFVKPLGLRNVRVFSQVQPQVEWLREELDFIGRYEQLDKSWDKVLEQIGSVPCPIPHKHNNKRRRKDYRTYYTDDLAEKVGEYYSEDIERFGYKF